MAEARRSLSVGCPAVPVDGATIGAGDGRHRAASIDVMTPPAPSPAADLDLVVLGGGGHVGLPLSLAFAAAGKCVGIFDIDQATLDRIAAGEMPFMETGADELLRELLPTGRLELSTDASMIARTETLIVVIGTPVDEFLGPSMTIFERAVEQIAPHLRDGALVVLRSTVYPGTTAYVGQHLAARGCRADVSFCPERIAEGHALEELSSLPQIIGADTEAAGDRAEALFGTLAAKTIRTTTKEAELAKLFTNTWRYMKFAIANQFLMIADQAGVDYTNILRAIREDYPRAADLPGPGFAAGPCLFKDTMQLAAFTSDHFPLGHTAMQVNEGLPAYIVSALERRYGGLAGRTIGILGMAFKAESDDTRASLSFKLRKLLTWAGATVLSTDPYVTDDRLVPLERVLAESEVLILGAPHRQYRGIEIGGTDVVDVWGAMGGGIRL
jgi:UDP-N-acetyl-D-mannosaminuronic acid dehydrogenase